MKKDKFLALTMLCSLFSGVSANAQEVKDSGSQTTGEVKNSSGNKGTSNSDKNVEKVTKKDPNSKKAEGGNSSGSKKPDAKKDDKEITKDKTKGSGEVSSKSFEWENFKRRFGDGISSFVDLVKYHPILSSIIGIGGVFGIEEGVRRTCFKQKNNNPHKPEMPPHKPGMPPHGPGMPPPQPVGIWGVNKFGYKEDEDRIYRNPNGKINVVLIGPQQLRQTFLASKKFRNDVAGSLKNLCNGVGNFENCENCVVDRSRTEFDNWNITEFDYNYSQEPTEKWIGDLSKKLKDDITLTIVLKTGNNDTDKLSKIINDSKVKKVKVGNKIFEDENGLPTCIFKVKNIKVKNIKVKNIKKE